MKILVSCLTSSLFWKRNTDLRYPLNLLSLQKHGFDIQLYNNRFYTLLYDLKLICFKILLKMRMKVPHKYHSYFFAIRIPASQIKKVDVIYSHGINVLSNKKLLKQKLLTNTGLMTDEFFQNEKQKLSDVDNVIRQIGRSKLVSFNNRDAINRFNQITENNYADKIVYLPFLLPGIKPVNEIAVTEKFSVPKRIKFLFAGTDGKRKGIVKLLEAIESLFVSNKEMVRNFDFDFVTVYPVQLPSDPDLHWHHFPYLDHPSLIQKMRETHIFCLPTLQDSFGWVFLEAMASGCAVIADNVQPRNEIFDNGNCCIQVNPHSAEEIKSAIEKYYYNPTLMIHNATAALKQFKLSYDSEIVKTYYHHVAEKIQVCTN